MQRDETLRGIEPSQTWTAGENLDERPSTGELKLGSAELPLKGQDTIINLPEQGVYGVFDGMGGVGSRNAGAIASRTAADVCYETYESDAGFGTNAEEEGLRMRTWLKQADKAIAQRGEMGTTATVIRMVKEGEDQFAVFGSVGDSRLYLYRNNQLTQITEDEGQGHVLYNSLGRGDASIKQVGRLKVRQGDRLMVCSDGITGDYGTDLLSDSEISVALDVPSPQSAADRLLDISRKTDDKSIIMVDIGSEVESSALREHVLLPNETVIINPDAPLEHRGSFSVVALVKAAQKELLILDLRMAPISHGGRIPFGETVGYWDTDFLVVDETFFAKWGRPVRGQGGYKGLRAMESLEFGRNSDFGRFSFPSTVSRKHFEVTYDGTDVKVSNHNPKNITSVTFRG